MSRLSSTAAHLRLPDALPLRARAPALEVGHAVRTVRDSRAAGAGAAGEAFASLRHHGPSAVLVFASARHDLGEVLRGVREVTGEAPLLGATGAGEIRDGEHEGSVVVAVLASPHLTVRVAGGRAASEDWRAALDEALSDRGLAPWFEGAPGPWAGLERRGRAAFAVVLSPGTTRQAYSRSWEILEELRRRTLGRLPIFGASAAGGLDLEQNGVLAGERALPGGLVVALFETELQFGMGMAHGFQSTGRRATVTASEGHEVLELDGRPAADAYAELLGSSRAAIEGKHVTIALRRVVGVADPFGNLVPLVAAYATGRGGVRFGRAVAPGTDLVLLEVGAEAVRDTGRQALGKAVLRGAITEPALALVSCCALRPILLGPAARAEADHIVEALGRRVPVVGLRSFGEQGPGDDGVAQHTNGVIGALVLGGALSQPARVARENERLRAEAAALHRRGREELERLVEERAAQLRASNDALRAEIAERRRAEEERARVAERLLAADRMAALGTLAAGVAHEVNNPLAAVVANLAFALEGMPEGVAAETGGALRDALEAATRVARIVGDLSAFSAPGAGLREEADLAEVVRSTLRVAGHEARSRARLVVDLEPVPPVGGDAQRIAQVFLHLLRNATLAIPPGRAEEHRIEVSLRRRGDRLLLTVADTGCGIPPERLGRIFDPFFTTREVGAGTGLGLSICHGVVGSLGGAIEVSSRPEGGSRFEVSLPVAASARRGGDEPTGARPERRRARVLVVDDELLLLRAVERVLSDAHDVSCMASARQALERIQAGERFDVLLCDLMMPDLTGMDLHARLAELAPDLGARTVFLTGGAFTSEAQAFLARVPNRVLHKPFDAAVLAGLVEELLGAG